MMAKRARPALAKPKQSYLVSEKSGIKFISSGCTLLDCALGGGYAIGRITNIVGDRSTAKTALATEAMINFLNQYNGAAAYRESEAAFDQSYAEAMGLPLEKIDFGDPENPLLTVEDFARDLDSFLDAQIKSGSPGIYVLDSLDALSDEAEMENDIGKASYGMAKAKALSTMFRKMARKIERSQVLLLIVSQVRDNIGVTFGEKHKRAGGKALDFYASQVLWLANIKTLKKTINKVERPYGVLILAKVKKNKVGLAFRSAQFQFIFGYGVEDLGASIGWLKEVGRLKDIELSDSEAKKYLDSLEVMSNTEYRQEQATVSKAVKTAWAMIETTFLPIRKKYD
jgi:recombination protein RecA